MKCVISTCLFNSHPNSYNLYAREAPKAADWVAKNLPGWKFRLYYDDTAPKDIVEALGKKDVVELKHMPEEKGRAGCFWRYLAFDDCDIVLCRDLDSNLGTNDLISLGLWLSSDKHLLCNWVVHDRAAAPARVYQAGYLGVRNLPFNMKEMVDSYTGDKTVYGADEFFLKDVFIPAMLKYDKEILFVTEPRAKNIELFPDIEKYHYLENNWFE